MFKIGGHMYEPNLVQMLQIMKQNEWNTCQIFISNACSGMSLLSNKDIEGIGTLNKEIDKNNVTDILIHAPFVTNLASDKTKVVDRAIDILIRDLNTAGFIKNTQYVLHPGNYKNLGIKAGIAEVSEKLNLIFENSNGCKLLLETMAGKGTEIGRNFEELASIIEKIDDKSKIGVCMDTCHINDAGYDLSNFSKVLDDFDKVIGLKYLNAIHLNNSSGLVGCKKDRHQMCFSEKGTMNEDIFKQIITDKRIIHVPKVLETCNDTRNYLFEYKEEIDKLKSFL